MRSLIDRQADDIIAAADPGDAHLELWLGAAMSEMFGSSPFMRTFVAAVLHLRLHAPLDLDALVTAAQAASPSLADSLGEVGLRSFLWQLVAGASEGYAPAVSLALEAANEEVDLEIKLANQTCSRRSRRRKRWARSIYRR